MLIPFNLYQTVAIFLSPPPVAIHTLLICLSLSLPPPTSVSLALAAGITFYHILKLPFNDLLHIEYNAAQRLLQHLS